MTKHKISFLVGVAVLIIFIAIVFLPYTTHSVISGSGEILHYKDETVEDCTLSIEISETRSLLFCYQKQFSYILNGEENKTFLTSSYSETDDGYCLISQMYYDTENDNIRLCSLFFSRDLSYAAIHLDAQQISYNNVP